MALVMDRSTFNLIHAGLDAEAVAADAFIGLHRQTRAVTAGSIDLPSLVEPNVIAKRRPQRLMDLLVNRQPVGGIAFEFFQQTTRTNNAAPVSDNAEKPTSVVTATPVEDRYRVIAHHSEPVPLLLLADHDSLRTWLNTEMVDGVLDALEAQVISGDGAGENMIGVLGVVGTAAVAFSTDVPTTMGKALTALQLIGVAPKPAKMASCTSRRAWLI